MTHIFLGRDWTTGCTSSNG